MTLIPWSPSGVANPREFPNLTVTWRVVVSLLYVSFLLVPAMISGIWIAVSAAALPPGSGREAWLLLPIAVTGLPVVFAMVWLVTRAYCRPRSWAVVGFFVGVWQFGPGALTSLLVAGPYEVVYSHYPAVCALLALCAVAISRSAALILTSCPDIGATDVLLRLDRKLNFRYGLIDPRNLPRTSVWLRLDRIEIRFAPPVRDSRYDPVQPPTYFHLWFSDIANVRAEMAERGTIRYRWPSSPSVDNGWVRPGGECVVLRSHSGIEYALPAVDAKRMAFVICQRMNRAFVPRRK